MHASGRRQKTLEPWKSEDDERRKRFLQSLSQPRFFYGKGYFNSTSTRSPTRIFLNQITLWTENDTLNQRLIIIINQANICLISADRVLVCVCGKARAPSVASLLSLPPRWQRNTPVISHSGICIFVASLPNANYSAQKQFRRTNRKKGSFSLFSSPLSISNREKRSGKCPRMMYRLFHWGKPGQVYAGVGSRKPQW